MSVLHVANLSKKFKDFTAVNNISFELKEGEIMGLLGPNGAGKTTTIQMLLGVLTPTSGDIVYFGKKFATHRSEILEKVNFSSTYTNLPWSLTVKENLTYISYLYNIQNRKKRVQEVVSLFKLETLLNLKMYEASAGQLTRINLAKAFLNDPKVLLLDEPTASLDPDIAQFIRDFLVDERKNSNLSIIFTSHNMPEVEQICDRVVFINHGEIIANDTPSRLARSVDTSHIELRIEHGLEKLHTYCNKKSVPYSDTVKYQVRLDVKEHDIPSFLQALGKEGIEYTEISIEKPSLEDYFLHISKERKGEHSE